MTKKPTGLSMARDGWWFTCAWKRGEKYDKGEQFGTISSGYNWTSENIGSKVTSKAFLLNLYNYYPYQNRYLSSVEFRVRGKKGGSWSGWSSFAFGVWTPSVPSVSVTADTSIANRCVFGWSTTTANNDGGIFIDCEYQSMLVANCNTADGSKLSWTNNNNGWKSGTGGASGTITVDETISIATGSHTRWFRVRSRGPHGASAWQYGRRVYAPPYQAEIIEAKATKTNNGYQAYVKWTGNSNTAYPTDTLTVDYTMATPDPGMVCPSGAAPTTAVTLAQSGATNAVSFAIDSTLGNNQALYARVNTVHSLSTTYGNWTFVAAGKLSAPTLTNVVTDPDTFRATITATNNATVTDSFLAILYRTAAQPNDFAVVGVIPYGSTSATVQCPDWTDQTIQFGVYAVVGSYAATVRADGVGSYEITAKMESDIVWQVGTVPNAPSAVTVNPTDVKGSVKVTWNWSWADANNAVISWADHEDAWASTSEPSEYTVSNVHASEWTIAGLETGKRWFVRVRLVNGTGDTAIYGPWSQMAVIDLSSAPTIPTLTLSSGIIPVGGSVSAYWAFVSTDGTGQAYAEITEATVDGNGVQYGVYALTEDTVVDDDKTYYELTGGVYVPQTPVGTEDPEALGWYEIVPAVIAHTETAQHLTLYADELGWDQDETHYLAVKVVSASGRVSDNWSDPVPVTIAEPLVATITATSLVPTSETVDTETRTFDALTTMPLDVTVTGAGTGGKTTLVIERAADYHIDRPDGTDFNGYEGETIFVMSQTGEAQMSIDREALIGTLDDGAAYRIVATVEDGLGQADTVTHEFEVRWAHQAVIPEGTVTIQDNVAKITPTEPVGYDVGDTVDIYRLSADRPELIVKGGAFDTTYVDPYPAIGQYGGHRLVYRTIDGDYITSDNDIAWLDLGVDDGDILDVDYAIINFAGEEIHLRLNQEVSNSWSKDFKETTYLGGSVQGDWNKGYTRTGTLKGLVVSTDDPDTIRQFKMLATWDAICHIRTPEGSSYACDIQVSDDMSYNTAGKAYTVNLKITRVEPEGLDGQELSVWDYEESE